MSVFAHVWKFMTCFQFNTPEPEPPLPSIMIKDSRMRKQRDSTTRVVFDLRPLSDVQVEDSPGNKIIWCVVENML